VRYVGRVRLKCARSLQFVGGDGGSVGGKGIRDWWIVRKDQRLLSGLVLCEGVC
jgi:hypothetical protein